MTPDVTTDVLNVTADTPDGRREGRFVLFLVFESCSGC
jgi:hypothetical protein